MSSCPAALHNAAKCTQWLWHNPNTNAAAMPLQECVQAAQVFLEWLRKAETDSDDEASGDDESSGSDGSG